MRRVQCLRIWMPDLALPELSRESLKDVLPDLCEGRRSFEELRRAPWLDFVRARFDHRTLQVIESEGRYDYRKLFDPEWTALDVAKNLPPDQLALELVNFTERASARAVREALGVVTITDPKPVAP